MGTAIVIVSIFAITAFLVWVVIQPKEETTYGRQAREKREAKKEANRTAG